MKAITYPRLKFTFLVALRATLVLLAVACSHLRDAGLSNNSKGARQESESPGLHGLRQQGNTLFRSGKYLEAMSLYEQGYAGASRQGLRGSALRFLNNLGSAHYQLFQYRDAIRAYLVAKDLALQLGNNEMLVALCINLSSLYQQMGDVEGSAESARQGLLALGTMEVGFRAKLLIQCALVESQRSNAQEAFRLLHEAIDAAQASLDTSAESEAWNDLGSLLLKQGNLRAAEQALLEGFRIRKLTHDDRLFLSHEALAELFARKGDHRLALVLFDRAIELGARLDPAATWNIFYERGKTLQAAGLANRAFDDLRTAVRLVRRWRLEVLPADAFRISSEVEIQDVYSAFIQLGNELYRQMGQKRLAEETFEAAEENRSSSLVALWAGPDLTTRLAPTYWEALANLHKAEGAVLRDESAADETNVQTLRLRVSELETRANLDLPRYRPKPDPGGLLRELQRGLGSDEVYLGFHVSDVESCVWAITREGFDLRRLPDRADLSTDVSRFVDAIRQDSPDLSDLGKKLYSQLFDAIDRRLLDKPRWIVAADGPLFNLPFAALVENVDRNSNVPVYTIQRHTIEFVPSALAFSHVEGIELTGPFVGLGDPIYNRADPRWTETTAAAVGQGMVLGATTPATLQLNRLIGSGREIASCARIWKSRGFEPLVLTGGLARKGQLTEALSKQPGVLHVAAHLVFSSNLPGPGAIALSLAPNGLMELLSATEISSMRTRIALVVIDGCDSGTGTILPGAGLMGMTRAWLAAGARKVIATRWEIPDLDSDQFFQSFYSHLLDNVTIQPSDVVRALREAQLLAIGMPGRHGRPAHWAAYFCSGRT